MIRARSESSGGVLIGCCPCSPGSRMMAASAASMRLIGASASSTSSTAGRHDRAVLQQRVAAGSPRVERRAGHGEDETAEIGGPTRRDERAGPPRRLDHDEAEGDAGDQPVAAGKVARPRLPAERHLADRQPLAARDAIVERRVLRRVGPVEAAGHGRDRAGGKRRLVRGGIDAAGETGNDRCSRQQRCRARASQRTCIRRSTRCAHRRCRRPAAGKAPRLPLTAISGGAPSIARRAGG